LHESANEYYDIPPAMGHMLLQGPIVPGNPSDSAKFKGNWIKGYKNLGMYTFSPAIKDTVLFEYNTWNTDYFITG